MVISSNILRNYEKLKIFLLNCNYLELINYLKNNESYNKRILKMLNIHNIDNLKEKIDELKFEQIYNKKNIILNLISGFELLNISIDENTIFEYLVDNAKKALEKLNIYNKYIQISKNRIYFQYENIFENIPVDIKEYQFTVIISEFKYNPKDGCKKPSIDEKLKCKKLFNTWSQKFNDRMNKLNIIHQIIIPEL